MKEYHEHPNTYQLELLQKGAMTMTMKEYIVKIHADDFSKLYNLLCNAVEESRTSSISAFYFLVENGKSLAHLHTDNHLDVERTQANDIANLLNAMKGSHRGLSKETKTDSDNDGIAKTVDALAGLDIFERCARRYGRLWADQIELDKQKKEIEENYRALTSLRSSTRSSST